MYTGIETVVEQCPKLHMQVNLGERHRITRSDIKRGSLWVIPRLNYFSVFVTGEVETLLINFLYHHFGAETGEDQGRKYWNIKDSGDVARIIRRFDEL